MKYAIIQLSGQQFVVKEGEELVVNRLTDEVGQTIGCTDVLLVNDGDVKVGTPLVDKAKVELKVLSHEKADKIRVFKYKSKSRYRKTQGHRQYITKLQIASIAS